MPWNDNANPGPWGAPPPGGEGERPEPPHRPRGGGPGRPNLGAEFERLRRRLRQSFGHGGGFPPGVVVAIVAAMVALWLLSGVYFVQPNEAAVVTTFGAYSRDEGPGARYHLPAPIEQVQKVPVTNLQRIDVGGTPDSDVPQESLMLTRDENIVDLDFSVAWKVADPARFVFTIRDPEATVKAVAESAMREVVGKTDLQPIISTGRGQVQEQTAELMQRILDSWGAGITVVEVQIRSAQPPHEVQPAFRDVANAEQDKASAVNEAMAYRNRVIAEARGDAARITQSAEAYREQAVRLALGDASRFNAIYGEYRRAPGATRDRLYIETMQRVLSGANKVIVDGKGASAPIILPPDVFRPKTSAAAAPPAQQQQQQQQQASPSSSRQPAAEDSQGRTAQ